MKKFLPLALLVMLPSGVKAADDDAPFEDFSAPSQSGGGDESMTDIEKEIDAELSKDNKKAPEATASKKPPAKAAPQNAPTFDQENAGSLEDDLAAENSELDKSLADELQSGKEAQKQQTKTAEPPPSADDSLESGLLSDGLEAPVKGKDENLSAVDVLEAQLDNRSIFGTDGGDLQRELSKMTPSEIFARIPLRSPMSDANWIKWAGPMIEKNYIVRKKDTLWTISGRLFGTPYLWPKIWHLNARVTNPNIIEPRTILSFQPGNPTSAPELAYTPAPEANDPLAGILPVMTPEDARPATYMERVDRALRNQLAGGGDLFREFLLEKKPRIYAELPKLKFEGHVFYTKGIYFNVDCEDGLYNVVSIDDYKEDLFFAYRMRWRGTIRVQKKVGQVVNSFSEMTAGMYLVKRNFQISPLAIHEATLGPVVGRRTKLVPLAEDAHALVGANQILGVRFPYSDAGPRPGAILTFDLGNHRTGKALLIDRDQRVGTLWMLQADREVLFEDTIL